MASEIGRPVHLVNVAAVVVTDSYLVVRVFGSQALRLIGRNFV